MVDQKAIQVASIPQRPLGGSGDRLVLVDGDGPWTVRRLRRLVGQAVDEIKRHQGRSVVVRTASPARLTAVVLACWTTDREPLLVDPSLGQEQSADVESGAPVFTARTDADHPAAFVLEELPADEVDPSWPAMDRVAVRFLTSGSSGIPKLVCKRGYQLFEQASVELPLLGIKSGVRGLCLVPPFHILGFMYGLIVPLCSQGRGLFPERSGPVGWLRSIEPHRPDYVVAVPSHYRFLARTHEKMPSCRLWISSGAPLPEDVDRDFHDRSGVRILQIYGSTETGGVAVRRGQEAWVPFPNLDWRVEEGTRRLQLCSPWQETPCGWYTTDDLAEEAEHGFRLIGRADSIVKIGGKRVATAEVNRAALSIPGVDSAETVTYLRYGEPALAMMVVPKDDVLLEVSSVYMELEARLAPHQVPRAVFIEGHLPLLPTGKTDLQAIRLRAEGVQQTLPVEPDLS